MKAQSVAKQMGIVSEEKKYKILILDWDVHHGNGTQHVFYDDPSILYISLHRYEYGYFYPSSEDADHDRVGRGDGAGFNINIAWNDARMGDPEYYLAFEKIVMPVAESFDPHLVLVSSGFDAGKGDPLGGFKVTPRMYGYMSHRLQTLADGKVVIVLEGGYNLKTVSDSVLACTEALLEFKNTSKTESMNEITCESRHAHPPKMKSPNFPGISCVLDTIKSICPFWKNMEDRIKELEDLESEIKRSTIDNLTAGFETLVVTEDSAGNTGQGHRYGTRNKPRSSDQSNAHHSSTEDLSESEKWEDIEFAPPGSLQASAPVNPIVGNHATNGNSSSITEYSDVSSDQSSFYSAHSTTHNESSRNNDLPLRNFDSKPDLPHDESCEKAHGEIDSLDSMGAACGGPGPVPDKTDINAVTLILETLGVQDFTGMNKEDMMAIAQAGLSDDASGYTIPKDDCPHVRPDFNKFKMDRDWDIQSHCASCGHEAENWSCLTCGQVFCGRFINGHMVDHFRSSNHPITLSHSDLSFWCYECDSYLNNFLIKPLKDIYKRVHMLKHGVDAPI